MADGGEGTTDTLVESMGGRFVKLPVIGPTGKEIKARFGILPGNTAIIEMASASGLWLVPENERNPMLTTTYGTGQMIAKAMEHGCKKIIIGIGGSATNDAGMGMAQALGVKFYDKEKNLLGKGGKFLNSIESIDLSGLDPNVGGTLFYIACDVTNPLHGPSGAAYVYGPQKGADPEMVKELDRGLINFANAVKNTTGKDIAKIPGAGAAGGLGAGLVAFLDAKLRSGTDIIIEATSLDKKIRDCDLAIAGEGAMDNQTFYGKSSFGVANLAKKYGIPVITINGSVFIDYSVIPKEKHSIFNGNFSTVNKDMTLEEAIKNGKKLLYDTTAEVFRFFRAIYYFNKTKTGGQQ
jgi:glycerate kinase